MVHKFLVETMRNRYYENQYTRNSRRLLFHSCIAGMTSQFFPREISTLQEVEYSHIQTKTTVICMIVLKNGQRINKKVISMNLEVLQ